MIIVRSEKDMPFGAFSIKSVDLDSSSSVLASALEKPIHQTKYSITSKSVLYQKLNRASVKQLIVDSLKKAIYFKSQSDPNFDSELLNTSLSFIQIDEHNIPKQISSIYSALLTEFREFLFFKYGYISGLFAKTMYFVFHKLNQNIEIYIEDLYRGKTMVEIMKELEQRYKFEVANIVLDDDFLELKLLSFNPEYIIKAILLETDYYHAVMQYETSYVTNMEIDMFVSLNKGGPLSLLYEKDFFIYQKSYTRIVDYIISRMNLYFFQNTNPENMLSQLSISQIFELYDQYAESVIKKSLEKLLREKYENNQYLYELLFCKRHERIDVVDIEPTGVVSEFTNKQKEISRSKLVFVGHENVLGAFDNDSFFKFYIQTYITEIVDFTRFLFGETTPEILHFCYESFVKFNNALIQNIECSDSTLDKLSMFYKLSRESAQAVWNIVCSIILSYYSKLADFKQIKPAMIDDMYVFHAREPSFENVKRVYEYCIGVLMGKRGFVLKKDIFNICPLLNNNTTETIEPLFFDTKTLSDKEIKLFMFPKISELSKSETKNNFRINKILFLINKF